MLTVCNYPGVIGCLLLMATGSELHASLESSPLHPANLATTQPARSFGIVKGDGQLTWPSALLEIARRDQAARCLRWRIGLGLRKALDQARYSPVVESGLVKQLQGDVRQFGYSLRQNVGELSFQQYVEAKRFLNDLNTALTLMRRRR
jgi:hypothetical protein